MIEEIDHRASILVLAALAIGLTLRAHPLNIAFLVPIAYIPFRRWGRGLGSPKDFRKPPLSAEVLPSECHPEGPLPLATNLRGAKGLAVPTIALLLGLYLTPTPVKPIPTTEFLTGPATVASVPNESNNEQVFDLQVGNKRFLAYAPKNPPLVLGDQLDISAIAKPPAENSPFLLTHRDIGTVDLKGRKLIVTARGPWINRTADGWRRQFADFVTTSVGKKGGDWLRALVFREGTLEKDEKETLAKTGTVHLITAGGLHIFALAFFVNLVCAILPIPRTLQILGVALVLTLFALATGLQPSTIRAVVMTIIYLSAYKFARDPDPLSALCVASIGVLLWQPFQLDLPGFQLSFVSVAALILFATHRAKPPKNAREFLGQRLLQLVKAGVILSLATEPLIAYHFGTITTTSIFSNALVVGVATCALILSTASFALSPLFPAASAGIVASLAAPMAGWIFAVSDWFASLPSAVIQVPEFNAYWLAPYYGAGLMLWRLKIVQP